MEFFIAEKLGKFHYEIETVPCEEFENWKLYFQWKASEEKQATKGKKGRK